MSVAESGSGSGVELPTLAYIDPILLSGPRREPGHHWKCSLLIYEKKVGFLRNKMRISTGTQLRIAAVSDYLCFLLKIVQCVPIVFRGSCLFLAWNSRPFSFHPLAAVQPPLSWLPTPFCSPLRTSLSHRSSWCTLCSHSPLPLHPALSSSTANSYSCRIHPLVLLLSQAFFDSYCSSKCPLGMRP